jgi:hypothetical protein
MRSYAKAMLAIPDRPDSFDRRLGNWGSVSAGRFGDTSSPILGGCRGDQQLPMGRRRLFSLN